MKAISNFLFLYFNICLLSSYNVNVKSIIINPTRSIEESNPINYIIIAKNKEEKVIGNQRLLEQLDHDILQNYKKLYYDSYNLSPFFFSFCDSYNNIYLLLKNKFYYMTEVSGIYAFKYLFRLDSDFLFVDYIIDKHLEFSNLNIIESINDASKMVSLLNNIIIYGKKNKKICFYYIYSKKLLCSDLENIDGYISCKLFKEDCFICIYSTDTQIKISILSNKNEEIIMTDTYNMDYIFEEYDNLIYYDIDFQSSRIICGRKKNNGKIKCIAEDSLDESQETESDTNSPYNINAIFSFEENNCNYTKFNSEYLFCCGKTGIINCERRDMNLQLINLFNITFPGKITNLTIEQENDSFLKLLYNNKTATNEGIYEYYIYPPKCKKENIILITYHSYTLNMDNLFEKKTNTNYYIILEQIPFNYGRIYINGELIQNLGEKIKLKKNNNFLYFISDNDIKVNNFEIKYNISIEETYSDLCSIFLTIKSCYHSCSNCTLSKEESDENFHNCISCAEGYYPFSEGSSNCAKKEQIENNEILSNSSLIQNSFSLCHSDCIECDKINKSYCLSCKNKSLFL